MSIAAVILINVYLNYLRANDYVMHTDVHFIVIVLLTVGTQLIVQKQSVQLKESAGLAISCVTFTVALDFNVFWLGGIG